MSAAEPLACPRCGVVCDDATFVHAGDFTPAAGDVSVCLYCCAVNIFTGRGVETRAATLAELESIIANEAVVLGIGRAIVTASAAAHFGGAT